MSVEATFPNFVIFLCLFNPLETEESAKCFCIEQSDFASATIYNVRLRFIIELVGLANDPKQFFFDFSEKHTTAYLWRVVL